ncbi:MAG: hypothetical protein AMXMBFR33_40290 [Candidatus Xenobia bacterium]|jgi:hypothetical protein
MRILICTEEAPGMQSAVWLGVELARRLEARATLLAVMDDVDDQARENLRQTRRWLRRELELEAFVAVTEGYRVDEVVLLREFDLVLLEGFDLDRATELLPQAPPPHILFVRPGSRSVIERILLCTDCTFASSATVELTTRLAAVLNAEVTVLLACQDAEPGALVEQEKTLQEAGLRYSFRRGEGELPEEVMRAHAETGYDLTVLASPGGWAEAGQVRDLLGTVQGSFLLTTRTVQPGLLERVRAWLGDLSLTRAS